jgi:sedoheptulose-bisphosphatase
LKDAESYGVLKSETSVAQAPSEFTVYWDPLDRSSIVDNNWAVGTIMGIWPKSTGLIGATGREQVTSLVALYGPRTTVLVALDDGTYEFTYGCIPEASWEPWLDSGLDINISEEAKIVSPANLLAAQDVPPVPIADESSCGLH